MYDDIIVGGRDLYDGKIIWTGTVKELDKTKNPYVRQFVAGSAEGPISTKTLLEKGDK